MKKLLITLVSGYFLTGCMSMLDKDTREEIAQVEKGPESAPTRNVTNFAPALRCMDNMFLTYAIPKTPILLEELEDKTTKVNAGTRDMMISTISDMTRRSRALKIIAFGNDSANLVSFLANAGQKTIYEEIPQFDIRGSITQLDKDVIKQGGDAGLSAPLAGAGFGVNAQGSILGLDLSIVSARDLSVIPGVTSRNSITVLMSGLGGDADGEIKKNGANFSFFFSKNEGQVQALRNLMELAAIELFGKLFKLPYWACLDMDPSNEAIKTEMNDWYHAMRANGELIPFLSTQLRNRGYYEGETVETINPSLRAAIASYRADIGIAPGNDADYRFFVDFLNQPIPEGHSDNREQVAMSAPMPTQETSSKIAAVDIKSANNVSVYTPGENLALRIKTSSNAYLFCYHQDESKHIVQFFPNRFKKNSFVAAGKNLELPGKLPFEITANENGQTEYIACFQAKQDIYSSLPSGLRKGDFTPLDAKSLEEIRKIFRQVAGGDYGEGFYEVDVK